jgi:hypothetical protein
MKEVKCIYIPFAELIHYFAYATLLPSLFCFGFGFGGADANAFASAPPKRAEKRFGFAKKRKSEEGEAERRLLCERFVNAL